MAALDDLNVRRLANLLEQAVRDLLDTEDGGFSKAEIETFLASYLRTLYLPISLIEQPAWAKPEAEDEVCFYIYYDDRYVISLTVAQTVFRRSLDYFNITRIISDELS